MPWLWTITRAGLQLILQAGFCSTSLIDQRQNALGLLHQVLVFAYVVATTRCIGEPFIKRIDVTDHHNTAA
jgi:hypothetical protein